MNKILKSRVSILFKIFGYPFLAGGLIGFYVLFFSPNADFKAGAFIQSVIFTFFSMIAIGYKSIIKIEPNSVTTNQQIFNFIFKRTQYKISDFDNIFVDIREPITKMEASKQYPFYGVSLRSNNKNLDLTAYIGKTLIVLKQKNWLILNVLTKELTNITGLNITYSDKAKSYNNIS